MNKLRYKGYQIVLQEVPDEISLAINVCGCPYRCEGCHSQYLWENDGQVLLPNIPIILDKYADYITCVCFMGEGCDILALIEALKICKHYYNLKTCLYTGANFMRSELTPYLDYYKVGPYVAELGGLNVPGTNQRMYQIQYPQITDITYKFLDRNKTK